MGMLSMNPDNSGLESAPKLSKQIAEQEEHFEPDPELPQEEISEKPPTKKMKLGPFELDTTYAKTLPGCIRIGQVLLLFLAFICLVATPAWPDSGSYTFFCLFLVFGAIISGYLFFSLIAGIRGEALCGFSWILVELVYFVGFGFLIFIGSCLAASKANGIAGLQVSAVFGFGAVATFGYYIWITWQLRKVKNKEQDEKLDFPVPVADEIEDDAEKRTISPEIGKEHNDGIDMQEMISEPHSRLPSMEFSIRKNRSLPPNFNEQLYENYKIASDEGYKPQGRQHRDEYPRELATNSFTSTEFNNDAMHMDTFNRSTERRRSMPDWLRAALGDDLPQTDVTVEESEISMPPLKRGSTLPVKNRREFPLLHVWEDESVNYPSISYNAGQMYSLPLSPHRQHKEPKMFQQRHRGGMHHKGGRRKGHHRHQHKNGHHHHHHGVFRPMHNQGQRPADHIMRSFDGDHEAYLREMMENDELVLKDASPRGMRRSPSYEGKLIENGRRRVHPEQPFPFPEKSRWDHERPQFDNQVMQKYLADAHAQQMNA